MTGCSDDSETVVFTKDSDVFKCFTYSGFWLLASFSCFYIPSPIFPKELTA